ncbi:MAG: hypothetical protein L3K14_04425 [Thermoplasmata archaeon]|nr:hypothetical protein [Thermoplasmata archaeon]
MRSLLVQGEVEAADLAELLPSVGAEVQSAAAYAFGTTRIVLYVGRKFYFRSSDYLGILLLAASDGASQRIDISYAGGGSGLMGVQWGAGTDLEASIFDAVVAVLTGKSLSYTELPAARES